jgi:putrescine transport system ATP-binding protein
MDAGRLEQVATPRELYEAPNSRWIAEFVGDINLFEGRSSREGGRLAIATATPERSMSPSRAIP